MAPPTLHYQVRVLDAHAHLFEVTLRMARAPAELVVSLPVWIPGSYLVREFAKHLQGLQAWHGTRPVAVHQLDKCSWRIDSRGGPALTLRYQVYALDNSVRMAWLDGERAFFNNTCLLLRVHGLEDTAHTLDIPRPAGRPDWRLATGLTPHKVDAHGFGTYVAADYDELADCPVEMGAFWSGDFVAEGVPHRVVVAGAAPDFDGARLLADMQAICNTEIRFWHGARRARTRTPATPHRNYVFLINAVHDGYGGLEHRNSTALICRRRDLPRTGAPKPPEGYVSLLGLISHEYFHTWNVKRLRPAELARYDYQRENYTELLWFFEGFTNYFDDLLLRRARLIDDATYLKLLSRAINQVQQTPGRQLQSVAQASFDAWIKYYRPDENTPNATVSYYAKGALVALCLDLSLRQQGQTTLDAVMRALWQRCSAGPMAQADLEAVLHELTGRSHADELRAWVHGTADLPWAALLEHHGVAVLPELPTLAQRLGVRVDDKNGSLTVKSVLRDSAAERAGLAAGDECLGVELGTGRTATRWRLRRLDDLDWATQDAQRCRLLVARDQRLLWLLLELPTNPPPHCTTYRLEARHAASVARWLD